MPKVMALKINIIKAGIRGFYVQDLEILTELNAKRFPA
jgi:hypothetical protein